MTEAVLPYGLEGASSAELVCWLIGRYVELLLGRSVAHHLGLLCLNHGPLWVIVPRNLERLCLNNGLLWGDVSRNLELLRLNNWPLWSMVAHCFGLLGFRAAWKAK